MPEVLEDDMFSRRVFVDRCDRPQAMATQVAEESAEDSSVVADVAERLVAVEAENAAHLAGPVVVIDVLRLASTGSAGTPLSLNHRVDLVAGDAITAPQVVFPCTPVETRVSFFALCVVARLAVTAESVSIRSVLRELLHGLECCARRAPLLTLRRHTSRRHGTARARCLALPMLAISNSEARSAISPVTIGSSGISWKVIESLLL
jgi:hypothetical protein